ncbi:hypothetical protein, partial [Burkholderia pseudomallei]|uniref:hypothetical protein n=1 Tax=Burkholderia pseudomallei TaxID=28450 RepID=UPI0029332F94
MRRGDRRAPSGSGVSPKRRLLRYTLSFPAIRLPPDPSIAAAQAARAAHATLPRQAARRLRAAAGFFAA